ncbi:hypothetical protein [Rhodococcus sp. Chr-9]|uniref:hypothetical protein n=1 Tax=Rhodococcus sp. Chr-9 TaxID=713612 RepID=UPI0005748A72|nr:hypothetical protein [Rhodococcus sp. Chr-9]KHJ73396.1 hypothetical protein QR64_07265 [Rhodococcus sp. Chr-9]
MAVISDSHSEVVVLDSHDSADLFDRIAQAYMSITGTEFLRRWDTGEFEGVDWDSIPGLAEVAIALPFARNAAE